MSEDQQDLFRASLGTMQVYQEANIGNVKASVLRFFQKNPQSEFEDLRAAVYDVWNYRMARNAFEQCARVQPSFEEFVEYMCGPMRKQVPWFPRFSKRDFIEPNGALFDTATMFQTPESLSAVLFGSPPRRTVFKYQAEDIERVIKSGHSMVLNLEMGLGKTTEALALIKYWMLDCESKGQLWTPSLVVAPISATNNWISETRSYALEPQHWARVFIYEGTHRSGGRGYSLQTLLDNDGRKPGKDLYEKIPEDALIIITTYPTLTNDYRKRAGSFLPQFRTFSCIVLDEAHCMRNGKLVESEDQTKNKGTKVAEALFYLARKRSTSQTKRYSATGTPYVNQNNDLVAQAKFLNCGATQQWFYGEIPPTDAVDNFGVVKRNRICYLTHPGGYQPSAYDDDRRARRLEEWITEYMVIRRKADVSSDLPRGLSEKRQCVSRLLFGPQELAQYEQCCEDMKQLLAQHGSVASCSAVILAKITYLRQLCLSVMLVTQKEDIAAWSKDPSLVDDARLVQAVEESTKLRTVLCDMYRLGYLPAAEALDEISQTCIESSLLDEPASRSDKRKRTKSEENLPSGKRHRTEESDGGVHSGEESQFARNKNRFGIDAKRRLRNERIVLSSESKSGISLIALCINNDAVRRYLGVEHLPKVEAIVYTGEVSSLSERGRLVRAFNDKEHKDGRTVVFLMTRQTGGLGINLFRARHIMIMDAWWNAAAVTQCIDRVHRFGQHRDVYVHRYPIDGSIEQYLLLLETRKDAEAMKHWGNEAQKQLAQMRYEALQNKAEGMLSNIVRFMRSNVAASSALGGRRSFECDKLIPLDVCVREKDALTASRIVRRGDALEVDSKIKREYVDWMIDELREDVGPEILDGVLSDEKIGPSPLLHQETACKLAKAAMDNLGNRAWHLFVLCRDKKEEMRTVASTLMENTTPAHLVSVDASVSTATVEQTEAAFNDKDYLYLRVMRQIAEATKIK